MILENLFVVPNAAIRLRFIPLHSRTRVAVLLTLLSLTTSGFAETAYSALRVVGAKRGEEILQRVIEVRGIGKREPKAWKIVVADSRQKAGVKEIEIRNGRITSESAPKKPRSAITPMDLKKLNLDSEGVLMLVDQQPEASAAQQISYTLSNAEESGTPVWVVKLSPPRKAPVTLLEIAADTGEIIAKTPPPVVDDSQFLAEQEVSSEVDPRRHAPAGAEIEPINPTEKRREKSSSPNYRTSRTDVPDLAKSVVKQVKRPIRLLRRFLP